MNLTRRKLLQLGAGTSVAALFGSSLFASQSHDSAVRLTAQPSQTRLGGAVSAFEQWSYPGFVEGRVLEGTVGDTWQVELENTLPVPTTLHWHGLRVPQTMDGVVPFGAELVMPGQRYTYDVPLKDPGLYWFHSHHNSLNQIARGLYGAIVVRDPDAAPVFEQALVLDDWTTRTNAFGRREVDWSALEPSLAWGHAGVLGNLTTINGRTNPRIELNRRGPTRLRLLNVATGRVFRPQVLGTRSWLIALDGFDCIPLELSEPIFLAPGQRADILVEPPQSGDVQFDVGDGLFGTGTLLPLTSVRDRAMATEEFLSWHAPHNPSELRPGETDQRHDLIMGAINYDDPRGAGMMGGAWRSWDELLDQHKYWVFNDVADGSQGLFTGRIGETVELQIANNSSTHHVIHLHGQHVKVTYNDKTPMEVGAYRDSISLEAFSKATIQMRLAEPGRWPIHCHILGHQVSGMWTWYETLA